MDQEHRNALPIGHDFEGYRIEGILGVGGFGVTYLATEQALGRKVALKEYLPAGLAMRSNEDMSVRPISHGDIKDYYWGLERFRQEAETLVNFHHPNIVAVHRFFECNGTAYLVMQFVEGQSLDQILTRQRVLAEADVMRFLLPILDGLEEVHRVGFLHRDVKPANIYLRMDGTPILLDFGAARQTLQRDISKTYPMYTPGFAAPELYKRDAELGPWTDVYSIGACIYACMSGMPPQESDQRLKDDKMPNILRSFRGLYSSQLISMVERCLRLNSLERPQTVYAVQKELVNNVPDKPEFSFAERAGARFRHVQERVSRFMKDHNITWF